MKFLIFVIACTMTQGILNAQKESVHMIDSNEFVSLYVEKTIYRAENKENFHLKFIVENKSDEKIGLYLRDYWKVIYPNQWGIYRKPYREVVNEERMIVEKTIYDIILKNMYADNKLEFVEPGESFAFFRDWNGSGEKIAKEEKGNYLIITIDGQLSITDGNNCFHFIIGEEEEQRAVVFEFPLKRATIPPDGFIIGKN